jgi:hypothetical protein
MKLQPSHWSKTIFWGVITALLYAALFYYSDLVLHMAYSTPPSCIVGHGATAAYYHKPDAAACQALGGHLENGIWWHVLIPILLAFAVSFAHGAFTGLFWDAMGLKAASHAAPSADKR